MVQKRRSTERDIARGLRAARSAGRSLARDVERAIIARGSPAKPIERRFERALRNRILEITRREFTGRDAPVKIAAAESILAAAGGDRKLAQSHIRSKNEFGKTLAQELQGARNKMLRRIRRTLREGIERKRSRREIAESIAEIAAKQTETKRVIAWHTARVANEREMSRLGDRFLISPSPSHPRRDICDKHFGTHRRGYPIPPYHTFCTCIVEPVA